MAKIDSYSTTTPTAKKIKAAYKKKFKEDPLIFPIVQMGYDAVKMYAKAMEGAETPQDITKNLHEIKSFEVSGPKVEFDQDGMANRVEKIYQIQEGRDVLVQS